MPFDKLLCKCLPPPRSLRTTPDPGTGMSQQDRMLVRRSWQKVVHEDAISNNGRELLIQLFKAYPYHKEYFALFKNASDDQLKKSPALQSLGARVLTEIGSYVMFLEEPDDLMWVIGEMAEHHSRWNVKEKQFREFSTVFIAFLKTVLGPEAGENVTDAWRRMLRMMVTGVENAQRQIDVSGEIPEE